MKARTLGVRCLTNGINYAEIEKGEKVAVRLETLLNQGKQAICTQVADIIRVSYRDGKTIVVFKPQASFENLATKKLKSKNPPSLGGLLQIHLDTVIAANSRAILYHINYDKSTDLWYLVFCENLAKEIEIEAASISARKVKIEAAKAWDKGLSRAETKTEKPKTAEEQKEENAADAAEIAEDTAKVLKYNWDAK